MQFSTAEQDQHLSTCLYASNSSLSAIKTSTTTNNNNQLINTGKEKQPKTFWQLVEYFKNEFGQDRGLREAKDGEVEKWMEMMQFYDSTSDVSTWQPFALGDPCRYTRNLVEDGNGKYNILILVWGPGMASPIHDHAGSDCILKVLEGELVETRYNWPKDGNLKETNASTLNLNQSAYMHDKIGLHKISNPSSTKRAVSLHVYSPPIDMCQTFCEKSGKTRSSGKCVFYSIFGKRQFMGSNAGLCSTNEPSQSANSSSTQSL